MDIERNIVVTPEILDDVAHDLETDAGQMKDICDKMGELVRSLEESWSDARGKKFVERFETEVYSHFKNYYNAISKYSNFISNASRVYKEQSAILDEKVNSYNYSGNVSVN